MSDSGIAIVACCCFFLCILSALAGYFYKKGIRAENARLAMCAFSSTPLVGTWTSLQDVMVITLVGTTYSIEVKNLTGTVLSTLTGNTLTGNNLVIPGNGSSGILDGLTLTTTKTVSQVDGTGATVLVPLSTVYTKTAC